MGVGYVPPGSVRQEREGHDVPRREHRRARAYVGNLRLDVSKLASGQVGSLGEIIAARFLRDRGATIVDRNLVVGRGEIDMTVAFAGQKIAVEVKSGRADSVGEPVYRFNAAKLRQVRKLGCESGVTRVDYVGVELGAAGAIVRWLPNVG